MIPTICKWNTDHMNGFSASLRKYLIANPTCKAQPVYEGYCSPEHMPYKLRLQYEWEQVPAEKRQEYLDLLHSGKSIGQAREIAGISFEAALEVTNRAIDHYAYLKREAE